MRRTQVLAALVVVSVALLSAPVAAVHDHAAESDSLAASTQTADLDADEHLQQQQQQQGAVIGSPGIEVHVPSPNLTPGQTNEVTVQISNDGELEQGSPESRQMVTTARSVSVEAEADGTPLTVESGEQAIGSVTENQPGQATIAVSVPEDVDPGNYDLEVDVSYSYTSMRTRGGTTYDESETYSEDVSLEVADDARFAINSATTDAQPGGSGTLEAEIENVGGETARNATVLLESASSGLTFGQSAQDSAYVDELEPGETATVTYDVAIATDALVREYPLSGTVKFETPNGLQRAHESISFGVTPRGEQQFTLQNVESDFYVGEEGELRGTVTNRGPVEARNVVVRYAGDAQSVIPGERSTAVGTLDPDETTNFSLPLSISGEAEAGLRSLDMAVQYRNHEGEPRSFENLVVTTEVAAERDGFDVALQNHTIQSGGTRTLEVAVTNNYDETVSDMEARLFASDPLSTGTTDSGYIQSLAPGETTTMVFDVAAASSAKVGGTYPISFDFRYTDSDGDTHLSGTFRTPLDVESNSGGGLPIVPILVVVLVVASAAAFLYRRRR